MAIGKSKNENYNWVVELASTSEQALMAKGKGYASSVVLAHPQFNNLNHALREGDGVVRRKALQLFSMYNPKAALIEVSNALEKDECPVVRHEAAFFLGALGVEEAVAPLCRAMLLDAEALVRHEAAEALGDLGFASALPSLMEAMKDGSSVVRDTAELAIIQIQKR